MRAGIKLVAAAALLAVAAAAAGAARSDAVTPNEVVLAMLSPLTGPLAFVGVDNRQGAEAAVREINAAGGVRGRQIKLEFYDDGSNPSQGVVHMNKIAGDSRYLGVIGSGFSSVGLAVAPIVSAQKIPYVSMASSAAQVTPAKPYYYMTTATSRLFAYSMAFELRKRNIKRIALIADNGGFGREGVANVKQLANRFGFTIVEEIIFPLTQTSFTADLTKVKSSGAQALWLWNATTLAVTITKEYKQLALPQRLVLTGGNASVQYLQPACPEANGALINTYLANVASFLPRANPSRPVALRVNTLLKKSASTFNFDGYTAVYMYKRAIEVGGFTRDGINGALQGKMKGFVGPGGRYYYSELNHSGLGLKSMAVSEVANCRLRPVPGQAVLKG
jgi:branched-chain amino acid transport system substrate-binding protein